MRCAAPARSARLAFRPTRRVRTITVSAADQERQSWDFGRFLRTVLFFNPPPTPAQVVRSVLEQPAKMAAVLRGDQGAGPSPAAAAPPPQGAVWLPDGSGPASQWGSLDDVVMGGVSSSSFEVRPGAGEGGAAAGVFSGRVTTANNGGFASVRTRNMTPPIDLSGYAGLELRVKGNGQRFKLIVRTAAAWDGIGYTSTFDTQPGTWQTVQLPWSSFVPVFRAKTVRDAEPFNVSSIASIQLMLSKFERDGALNPSFQEGAFELPVQRVSAYKAT